MPLTSRLLLFTTCLALPALAGKVDGAPELPRALPDSTALVVYVRSVPELRSDWEHTPLAHTWAEPDVQKFFAPGREKLGAELTAGLEKMRAETGLTVQELLGFFQGELVVAVADFTPYTRDEEKTNPQLIVAANIGGNRARIEELITKQAEKKRDWEQQIEEEFQGETLHVALPVVEAGEERREGEAWAIVGDVLWHAEPKVLLQQVIANSKGALSTGSILDKPAFSSLLQRQPDADVVAYLNLESLIPALVESARAREAARAQEGEGPSNPLGLPTELIVRGLGADALTGVYLAGRVAREATTFEFGLQWSEQRGLLRMLTYGDPPAPRPSFVPDTWMSVSAGRFSFVEAYTALKDTLRELLPPIEAQMQAQIAGLNQALGIDLERDFIGSIGDEVVHAQTVQTGADGATNPLQPTSQIFALALSNPDAFRRAVGALLNMAGPLAQQIESREYLGETISTFAPSPQAPAFSYAITRSRFLFCIGAPTMLETAIQNQGGAANPIWNLPEVEATLADLAPGASNISFSDARKIVSMLLDVFAGLPPALGAPASVAEGENGPGLPWDPAARPAKELVEKHWSTMAGAVYRERDGLRMSGRINHVE